MSDNVIIMGAGASFDAGVPLSTRFVEKIRDYALRGTSEGNSLSDPDKEVFAKSIEIMNNIYNYHGGANFDDRNIEDLLSILSFNIIDGSQSQRKSLNWMIQAIARTIELSCKVKHDGNLRRIQASGDNYYKKFWRELFHRFTDSRNIPTIITFNYDLVLERALFQEFINKDNLTEYGEIAYPFDGFILRYHYKYIGDLCYQIQKAEYPDPTDDKPFAKAHGTILVRCEEKDLKKPITINILKLHGSLNFATKKWYLEQQEYQSPTNLVNEPYIIPPISTKSISGDAEEIWKVALKSMREAKNIVIVGYSLPPTDIYVQYFLKTALGPNMDLNRITVFNPELFNNTTANSPMRERYRRCFSQQVMERLIEFTPQLSDDGSGRRKNIIPDDLRGTFKHFVHEIQNPDNNLFF